mgnify:CR=1 FL=1
MIETIKESLIIFHAGVSILLVLCVLFQPSKTDDLGSMFGGHKNKIPQIVKMVDDVLMDKMIAENNINNEQIALGYLVKKYPDDFAVYSRTNGEHMDLFTELSS